METFIDWIIPDDLFRKGLRIPFFIPGENALGLAPKSRAPRRATQQAAAEPVAPIAAELPQSVTPPDAPTQEPLLADTPDSPLTVDQLEPDDMIIKLSVFEAIQRGIQAVFARFPEAESIFRAFDPDLDPSAVTT
jgi:hypothetical protein